MTSFTDEAVHGLMQVLWQRGYLHPNDDDDEDDNNNKSSSISTSTTTSNSNHNQLWPLSHQITRDTTLPSFHIEEALIIPIYLVADPDDTTNSTSNDCTSRTVGGSRTTRNGTSPISYYITIDSLCIQFRMELDKVGGGRWNIRQAVNHLGTTNSIILHRILPKLIEMDPESLFIFGDNPEILTFPYIEQQIGLLLANNATSTTTTTSSSSSSSSTTTTRNSSSVLDNTNTENQIFYITDLARIHFKLPLDVTMLILNRYIVVHPNQVQIRTMDNGAKVLVTLNYLDRIRLQSVQYLRNSLEPIPIMELCQQHHWQFTWVIEFIKIAFIANQNEKEQDSNKLLVLNGELQGDVYVPSLFVQQQQRQLLDLFRTNGFVTNQNIQHYRLHLQQARDIIVQSHPQAVLLSHCMIHPDIILAPLEVVLQDTISSNGWVNLEQHIPSGLLFSWPDDTYRMIVDSILPKISNLPKTKKNSNSSLGLTIIQTQGAIFVSQSLIEEMKTLLLPTLIFSFTKTLAWDRMNSSNTKTSKRHNDDQSTLTTKKGGKSKKTLNDTDVDIDGSDEIIGIMMVPIIDIQQAIVEKYHTFTGLDKNTLTEFCHQVFHTEEHCIACEKSYQLELKRLEEQRRPTAKASRGFIEMSLETAEAAFENFSCFPTACYLLQAAKKFLVYATTSIGLEESIVCAIRNDFFNTICADMSIRLTQFCLFKNNIDQNIVSFFRDNDQDHSFFITPVDITTRRSRFVYLSCSTNDKNNQPTDPLLILRKTITGPLGVSVAQLWKFCGSSLYQNNDDGYNTGGGGGGDMDAFISHVEENCLPICGLPYKKYDKKSEKLLLSIRRQRLVQLLELAMDSECVLELSIMLLYQVIKNYIVTAGPCLTGPILEMLLLERKMIPEIVSELRLLSNNVKAQCAVDDETLIRVKTMVLKIK